MVRSSSIPSERIWASPIQTYVAVVLREPGIYSYKDTFYPKVESLKGVIEVRK